MFRPALFEVRARRWRACIRLDDHISASLVEYVHSHVWISAECWLYGSVGLSGWHKPASSAIYITKKFKGGHRSLRYFSSHRLVDLDLPKRFS